MHFIILLNVKEKPFHQRFLYKSKKTGFVMVLCHQITDLSSARLDYPLCLRVNAKFLRCQSTEVNTLCFVSCLHCLYMDSLCSHHAEIQYLYLIYNVYNVIILPFHSCKKKREPFTALFPIDFLIHLSYSTVCQPMFLNFFPKMG